VQLPRATRLMFWLEQAPERLGNENVVIGNKNSRPCHCNPRLDVYRYAPKTLGPVSLTVAVPPKEHNPWGHKQCAPIPLIPHLLLVTVCKPVHIPPFSFTPFAASRSSRHFLA
jgi:hypothetical protein